jgi:regulator of sigma E protease
MPDVLMKVGSIVLLLGGLIFIHELGHFLVAKLMGVKVVRFSIGFGPRLLGFQRGETEYQLALLPLGGYVKMAGDDPGQAPAPEDEGRGFLEQPPWRRLLIALAGPVSNLLFPGLIYIALAVAQNGELTAGPVIGTVAPGAPADRAGLHPGDRILAVTVPGGPSEPVRYFSELRDLVSPHPGEQLTLRVERDGNPLDVPVEPAAEVESSPVETTRRGVIGVTPSYAPAVVAPALPGAAGPLQPFDLVITAGGKPVRHAGELERALSAAGCGPIDLEVVREEQVVLPAVNLARHVAVRLPAVPTCQDGRRVIALADPVMASFVATVIPGSPADRAGLRRGDAIAAVNGKPVRSFRDVNALSRDFLQPGKAVALTLTDGRTVSLVPARESFRDEVTGEKAERLALGFQPYRRDPVDGHALLASQVPLARAPAEIASLAWRQLNEVVRLTVLGIARIVTGDISFKTVGGPIMLFSIASEAAEEGWGSFLFKMALISVNLGLMNLLPIPVLDGGHIAQAALEGVTRRPLSVRAREIANLVGIVLLFTLMLFVFKNDIVRLMRPME